jgi:putative endonuclease
MTNPRHTVLYIGVTGNLPRRILEHKEKLIEGFTKKYNCCHLIYYEQTSDVRSAIEREKELKGWLRKKKETLIATLNPEWNDLSLDW